MQTTNQPMQLYAFIQKLEEKKIYSTLYKVGAIPYSINTDLTIYEAYIQELEIEKRRSQVVFNVMTKCKCSKATVYRAIETMNQDINTVEEIIFHS